LKPDVLFILLYKLAMPPPRSIPLGQVQFTAKRYIALLAERGQRIPRALAQTAKSASTTSDALLDCINKLEHVGLVNQTDYLKIRTAARIRVLRGSGSTQSDYGTQEANLQRLRRAQRKAQNIEIHAQALEDWHREGRFKTYSEMMEGLPASQVVRADKLLLDLLNRYPCLSVAEYRLMLEQTDQTKRVNQP
jgi:hypothetical protein